MRKLASIRKVSGISPIEGRDRIELAHIDGWQVIVKKGEFTAGDLCVYIEIDSVLPEKPEFEFLRSKNFRIKTMKMADTVSQGICFPVTILPAGRYEEGQDVTDALGIKQYEPTMDIDPLENNTVEQKKKYPKWLMRFGWFRKLVTPKQLDTSYPSMISKSDETRIQNCPEVLQNREKLWVATEKIDGTNSAFVLERIKPTLFHREKFKYTVCSRNKSLPVEDDSSYWQISRKYNIRQMLEEYLNTHAECRWVVIRGEIVGPKIQKNKYKLTDYELYVFDVIDSVVHRYDSFHARDYIESVGMKFVPIVSNLGTLPETVDEVMKMVHGRSDAADIWREGLVFRSETGRDSFKAVDPEFLLKYDE